MDVVPHDRELFDSEWMATVIVATARMQAKGNNTGAKNYTSNGAVGV